MFSYNKKCYTIPNLSMKEYCMKLNNDLVRGDCGRGNILNWAAGRSLLVNNLRIYVYLSRIYLCKLKTIPAFIKKGVK